MNHPWVEGALVGFAIALTVFVLIKLNLSESLGILSVTNFVVSVPSYITLTLNITGWMMILIYFAYWVGIGSFLGWCIGTKGRTGKIAAVILLLVLAVCHYQANILMEKSFEAAIQQASGDIGY